MIVKNWGVERGMMLIILRIYLGLLYLSEATDFCCFPPRTAGNDVIFYWIQKICTYKARIKVAFLRTVKTFQTVLRKYVTMCEHLSSGIRVSKKILILR